MAVLEFRLSTRLFSLAAPAILATGTFAFVYAWSEFFLAFILSKENPTLTVGLYEFIGEYVVKWNELTAASLIITIPVAVAFTFLQKYLVSGLTGGAMKG